MGAPLAHIVAGVALLVAGASAPVAAFAQSSPWPGFTFCAVEFGRCEGAPVGAIVRFGNQIGHVQTVVQTEPGLNCSWNVFGSDPAPGYADKVCAYSVPDELPDDNGQPGDPNLPNTQLMAWAVVAAWGAAWSIKVIARGLFT